MARFIAAAIALLPPLEALDFAFVTIGDWGGATNVVKVDGSEDEYAVGSAMAGVAAEYEAQFVVNVGDNHYYAGVANTSDPQWVDNFEAVYTQDSLMVPWYSILGNHDYGTNPQAQTEYVSPNNDRWQMPSRYYSNRVHLGVNSSGTEQYATFVYLDTNPCIAKYRSDDPSGWTPPPATAPMFHENIVAEDCGAQLAWLKGVLGALPADDWLVVSGHHPLDEVDVEDFTTPLLASPMTLYLTGHLHLLRSTRLDGESGSKTQVLSGAGCMVQVEEEFREAQDHGGVSLDAAADDRLASAAGFTKAYEETVAGFTAHRFVNDFTLLYTEFFDYRRNVRFYLASHKDGEVTQPQCSASMVGTYCGDDGVGSTSPELLYTCEGGVITNVAQCPNGCTTAPKGSADYCT